MNEEALNTSMRKFLKRFGVTSQQEIEKAVRDAADAGTLDGNALDIQVTLTVPGLGLRHEVNGELVLDDD